ncbi:hypothetical protein [Thiomonas sp.]
MANLIPFRGGEPDSGTVEAATAAFFMGKLVVGYTTETRCVNEHLGVRKENREREGSLLSSNDGAVFRPLADDAVSLRPYS